jgi:hypothetical protein
VPLAQSDWDGDTLTVPFDKQALQAAPHHDPDIAISASDETSSTATTASPPASQPPRSTRRPASAAA